MIINGDTKIETSNQNETSTELTKTTEVNIPTSPVAQYEFNHERILQTWEDMFNESGGKRPVIYKIADKLGLDRKTVSKHLSDVNWEKDISPKHIININPVLDGFYEVLKDVELTPYQKGKLILEYVKLVSNPTQKTEVSTTITKKVLKLVKNVDNKTTKKIKNIGNIVTEDE